MIGRPLSDLSSKCVSTCRSEPAGARFVGWATLVLVVLLGSAWPLAAQEGTTLLPDDEYRVYVGSESSDYLYRIRFGPDGLHVEAEVSMASLYRQSDIGHRFTEKEAPHGLAIHPDSGILYMTTGHGIPDGKLWKVEAGTGQLLADPIDLGLFPASLDISPDGRYAFVVNFNLHGRMEPSSVSVVYTPEMMEVAQITTCTMPHGSRMHPDGRRHYSACMMDDQLVEIDADQLAVSRRLFLATGREGPLDADDRGFHAAGSDSDHGGHGDHAMHGMQHHDVSCSPTWVQPSHDGRRAWVACNASDQVIEVDLERWEVLRRFDTGRGPYNLDVTSDDALLVVTLKQGRAIELIDLEAGETRAHLDTSTRVVHGVALSPDARYAFISVEGVGSEPGKVDVFDLERAERVGSVAVGLQASGIAFWSMQPAQADESSP